MVQNVKVLVGISRKRLVSVLEDSNIVWSITGMDNNEADDPADAEHFGIALLEAMSTGMIPLVLNKGGPVEIVDQFPKYLQISTVTELAESTSRLLQNSLSDLRELSERARATARDMNIFHKEFDNMFNILGIRLTPTVLTCGCTQTIRYAQFKNNMAACSVWTYAMSTHFLPQRKRWYTWKLASTWPCGQI